MIHLIKNWLRYLLAAAILVPLGFYLHKHWQRLEVLFTLSPIEILLLYLVSATAVINNSRINQLLLGALKTNTTLCEMFLLQNTARLLNFLPLKFGTLIRGKYLKLRYGLSYARYIAFFAYFNLFISAVAGLIALVGLTLEYGLTSLNNKILAALFLLLFLCSLFFLVIPLPIPTGSRKLPTLIRNILAGRKDMSQSVRTLLLCLAHLLGTFVLLAIRAKLIFQCIGQEIHPTGYLILAAVGYATHVLSFTPGALGIKEITLSASAAAIGVPLEIGILAAMLDRAIMLSWTIIIGGGCTILFWLRYPANFKTEPSPTVFSKRNQ